MCKHHLAALAPNMLCMLLVIVLIGAHEYRALQLTCEDWGPTDLKCPVIPVPTSTLPDNALIDLLQKAWLIM